MTALPHTESLQATLEVEGKNTKLKGYSVDLLTDEALRFIDANKKQPFALLLHYREPHLPYTPPPPQDRLLPEQLSVESLAASGASSSLAKHLAERIAGV